MEGVSLTPIGATHCSMPRPSCWSGATPRTSPWNRWLNERASAGLSSTSTSPTVKLFSSALYERESAHIHKQVAASVQAETSLAGMLRAFVRGMLSAQVSRKSGRTRRSLRVEDERHGSARSNVVGIARR